MEERVSPLLVKLVVLFTSCLIISNVLANRLILVGGYSMDAGNFLFPVTYVLSDVFSEVYGYKWSRRVTWWAAAMNLLLVLLVTVTNRWPAPVYYDPAPFEAALSNSFRIVAASLVSYVVGDLVNDKVFEYCRQNSPSGVGFAARALLSSVAGQIVDSFLFVTIAFAGTMSRTELLGMVCMNIVVKTVYELVVLPVTSKVAKAIRRAEENYTI